MLCKVCLKCVLGIDIVDDIVFEILVWLGM